MAKIAHKIVPVNGVNMHVAELGEGPLILFIHGFPELWYSWRHQMAFVAEHGYRAVAPDMRGYGDTTGAPLDDPSKFTLFHLVGDMILLLDAIAPSEDKVFVVGHDWGALVAWHLCMCRPDRVKALVNLSVAFIPRDPQMSIVEIMRKNYGDDHYICRFQVDEILCFKLVLVFDGMVTYLSVILQEHGDIEAEFEKLGAKEVMQNFLALRDPGPLYLPKGKGFGYSAEKAPWLTEEELDYYATKFQRTGFTGGVNYYRALGLNWELSAPWAGAQVNVPVKYVVGEFDLAYYMPGTQDFVHKGEFKKLVPLLEEVVVIQGAAHFVNQERPDEINQHIHAFFKQF